MLTYSDYFLTLFVVLAFALADTKKIILCDVEKPESLHSFSVEAWHMTPLLRSLWPSFRWLLLILYLRTLTTGWNALACSVTGE